MRDCIACPAHNDYAVKLNPTSCPKQNLVTDRVTATVQVFCLLIQCPPPDSDISYQQEVLSVSPGEIQLSA